MTPAVASVVSMAAPSPHTADDHIGHASTSSSSSLSAPIPFITLTEDNTFDVADDAVRFFQELRGPVAIVSIAGLYRTGKSYLLNLLLGRDRAEAMFNVGATVNACTKGIWVWGQPLTDTAQDDAYFRHLKKDTTIVFMDTEGLGSTDRSQTQDTRIFALALLLSSLFIYNSRGVIDSNAIEDLSLVVHLTKHIQTRTAALSTNEDHTSELAAFFPDFLWVVRDFTLQLQEDGRTVTPREYFESALKPQPAINDEVAQKNKIRALLATFFPSRDCLTMVRPLNDEQQLRNLLAQPFESLRPEFREQLDVLKRKIYTSLKPKTMMQSVVNGPMLVTLARSYVDAFNSGSSPVITSVWDRVIESQCDQALETAKRVFVRVVDARVAEQTRPVVVHTKLTRACPLEEEDLYAIYDDARVAAERELAREELQTSDLEQYALALSEFMLTYLKEQQTKNDAVATAFNEALLCELYGDHDEKGTNEEEAFVDWNKSAEIDEHEDGARALHDRLAAQRTRLDTAVTTYHRHARGATRSRVLAEFLTSTLVDGLVEWSARVRTVFRAKTMALETQTMTARQSLRALEGKVKAAQDVLTQQKETYERALVTIAERIQDERATLQQELLSREGELERAQLQMERITALHKEAIDRLDAQLDEAKREREQLETMQRDVLTRRETARLASQHQLLESARNFHREEKELLQSQQELLSKVVERERDVGEQDTVHMKELFRLEKEGQSQLSSLRLQYQEEQDALKEQTIQDLRALKDKQDEELMALQDTLSQNRARLAAMKERLEAKEAMALRKKNKVSSFLGSSGGGGGKDDCLLQ